MNEPTLHRVERVCAELTSSGQPAMFATAAEDAQISRATLYRDDQLRAITDEHRARQAGTRTVLASEVADLRTAVEALAVRAKRHEELLRTLTTSPRRCARDGASTSPDWPVNVGTTRSRNRFGPQQG